MPSIFSRKTKGSQSVSYPYIDQRSIPGQATYSQPATSAQFPPENYQHTYTSDARAPHFPPNSDAIGHSALNNLQRSTEDPASASPTAHESPNLDQRDSEPKKSIRERFGLSRENLLDIAEDSASANRLRRKPSARKKETYQYSPQSPPPSATGLTTPQFGKTRSTGIPEETETERNRSLASFLRSTAPPSDPRRRPVSLVGDPSTAQAHWNKLNNLHDQASEDSPRPGSRPRSGSLSGSLERGATTQPTPPQASQSPPANPLEKNTTGPIQASHPQYQAYHPVKTEEGRQQPSLPPLQTRGPHIQPQDSDLPLSSLSPLRQNPVDRKLGFTQAQYSAESPPHFEVQGLDQRQNTDSLEHGIASELTGHLSTQQTQAILGSPPRQVASPVKEISPGMPTNQANLQLPPRRGSGQEGSDPPTPGPLNQSRMQSQQQQQQQASNYSLQRAHPATDVAAGRSTPPPQITAKDMSEEEVNNLLRDYKELREKYSKVKRYYFDKDNQVQTLQNALAHQKLSQSRTSLDDGEYMQRLERLNGLISQLAYAHRKDWKNLPLWLQTYVNKDAITVGKQEMTAVGRAFISKWLMDEVFNKYFHPGLDSDVSKEIKKIQNNLRIGATALQTGEEEDALTVKIINWRLATVDGLQPELNSTAAGSRRQNLIQLLDAQLISSLTEHMHQTPPGLEGGVHMIIDLAVTILMHLPFESRDVFIEFFPPGCPFDERIMRAETANLPPPLGTPMAEPMDTDRLSVHSDASDNEGENDETMKSEKQEHRRGVLKQLMTNKKGQLPPKAVGAGTSQNSLLQPPGSSSGPKEDRVRFCTFLALSIRGKMVLSQAPVYKIA